jgi:transposase
VLAVECVFSWYWIADFCEDHGIDFVLGHALYMKAINGGKGKNDRIDSFKIASILRGGTFPMAYVYPFRMRATRDLLRRRTYLMRQRAELLTHIQQTNIQYNLPPFQKRISSKNGRSGISERFSDQSAARSVQTDVTLIDFFDDTLNEIEREILASAKEHNPQTLTLLQSICGVGPLLSLVILYEIHDIRRFPNVGHFLSYSRLVKCNDSSAGKKHGTSGDKIGNPHLRWAFSQIPLGMISHYPEGKRYYERLLRKHCVSKALNIMAARFGRAVYYMLKRNEVFDMKKFLTN